MAIALQIQPLYLPFQQALFQRVFTQRQYHQIKSRLALLAIIDMGNLRHITAPKKADFQPINT